MMRIEETPVGTPVRTPETDAFWDAANRKQLLYAHCNACQKPHAYPRRVCPFCLSADVGWNVAAGGGTIHAFSLFRRAQPAYVSAWVMLNEGAAILTNIVNCNANDLRIGTRVEVTFVAARNGQAVPVFTPLQRADTPVP